MLWSEAPSIHTSQFVSRKDENKAMQRCCNVWYDMTYQSSSESAILLLEWSWYLVHWSVTFFTPSNAHARPSRRKKVKWPEGLPSWTQGSKGPYTSGTVTMIEGEENMLHWEAPSCIPAIKHQVLYEWKAVNEWLWIKSSQGIPRQGYGMFKRHSAK